MKLPPEAKKNINEDDATGDLPNDPVDMELTSDFEVNDTVTMEDIPATSTNIIKKKSWHYGIIM